MGGGYRNGEVPDSWLIKFDSGYNAADGNWVHSLPPSTYQKHLALVALAKQNTGRDLRIGVGWCAYRPLAPQIMLKKRMGIMAATPGTSSHGGFWEGRQVMAVDYSNWSYVYGGDRAAWFRDVRAVGLEPDLISLRRGYPDEPWHVVDMDPWAEVSAPAVVAPVVSNEEEDMLKVYVIVDGKAVTYALGGPGYWWEWSGTTVNGPKTANRLVSMYNRTGPAAIGTETAINLTYEEWRANKAACTGTSS